VAAATFATTPMLLTGFSTSSADARPRSRTSRSTPRRERPSTTASSRRRGRSGTSPTRAAS
jgi:hypothetical protein